MSCAYGKELKSEDDLFVSLAGLPSHSFDHGAFSLVDSINC